MLPVEDVGETARDNKVMLISSLSLLLEAQILYLRKLSLKWIVRREKKIRKDLHEIISFVFLELHYFL